MKIISFSSSLSLLFLFFSTAAHCRLICPNGGGEGGGNGGSTAKIDILLLVDQSTDYFMPTILTSILNELQWLCTQTLLSFNNGSWYTPDTRVAVVGFGGPPRLLLPFTSVKSDAINQLKAINSSGQMNEASFEALRMSLSAQGSLSGLQWRSDGLKLILLFTDEDSDLPTSPANCADGQLSGSLCAVPYLNQVCSTGNRYEPDFSPKVYLANGGGDGGGGSTGSNGGGSSPTSGQFFRSQAASISLTAAFQAELNQTARLLIQSGASIIVYHKPDGLIPYGPISVFNEQNLFWQQLPAAQKQVKDTRNTQQLQFGDPGCNTFDNAQNLLTINTRVCLQSKQLHQSLQSQLLSTGQRRIWVENIDVFRRAIELNSTTTYSPLRKSFSTTLLEAIRNLLRNGACIFDDSQVDPWTDPDTPGGIIGIISGALAAVGLLVIGATILYRRRVAAAAAAAANSMANTGLAGHVNNPYYVPRTEFHTNEIYERRLTPLNLASNGRRGNTFPRSTSDTAINQ